MTKTRLALATTTILGLQLVSSASRALISLGVSTLRAAAMSAVLVGLAPLLVAAAALEQAREEPAAP